MGTREKGTGLEVNSLCISTNYTSVSIIKWKCGKVCYSRLYQLQVQTVTKWLKQGNKNNILLLFLSLLLVFLHIGFHV